LLIGSVLIKGENILKKIFSVLIVFLLLMVNTVVSADTSPSASINIKGNIEAGQNIQILINVSDIKNLYAGAAKFKYDKNILKVTGFEKGDLINKSGVNVFDVGNKIDNNNGIAEFGGFSCLGKVAGFSGSGTFLIINAEILKKDNFHIKSIPFLADTNEDNNLKIQFVDSSVKDMNYNFTGYDFKTNSNGTPTISKPRSEEATGNTIEAVSGGTKSSDEGKSGINQNNSQDKSVNAENDTNGNDVSNPTQNSNSSGDAQSKNALSNGTTNGNNVSDSNENSSNDEDKQSNDVLNSSTTKGNNSKSASSKTKRGASSGKNQDSGSAGDSNNPKTNNSKNKNIISAKEHNIYIIVGICILGILGIGFALFKFVFKKNIDKKK
jgi:hypothetical protein